MTSRSSIAQGGEAVFVVGGRGFVGSHVTRALVEAGLRPHLFGPAMADDLLADVAGRFDESEGSLEDRAALAAALRRSGAKRIVSLAAHSAGRAGLMRSGEAEGDRALAVNVLGFRNLLEAAVASEIERLVWASSTVVYGPSDAYPDQPVNEDAAVAPLTFYGLTKVLAEDLARYYRDRHGLDVVGLRLPLVLGPGLWYEGAASTIAAICRGAAPGGRIEVAFHDEPMDLMHVADVADAMVAALAHAGPLEAVYNINGFPARLSEIIAAAEAAVPGYEVAQRVVEPQLRFPLIDDARFRRAVGHVPAYGLSAVVSAMLDQGKTSCSNSA